ncbi:carboxymuconolactone decarboxylase family protein [Glacieibacterium megasporae]|uniref:carboxymuconolactone decarboxylase family protein n=1 Tax=Glacieibacterium megasporae TaxID=2835787 RepID=UPI001C1E01EB|nr:carboxymuconolactone decarboxylase family protein [Polymorphobacter megasporae]UAJ10577.1 carboxymuconolactone decarboxylase family protein [Polymorphobacter megasporae]
MISSSLYAAKTSVPIPDDDLIREVIGPSYNAATTLNVVKMMAGTEDMFDATVGLVKAVFAAQGVDPRIRQMIILRAANKLDSPYEWQANVPMSLNNGLSQIDCDAASADGSVTGVNDDYVLVCKATDELCDNGTLTDSTLQSLLERFGAVTTRKLILIIAWFNLLSLFLNGCRVPLETTDKIGSKKSPLE